MSNGGEGGSNTTKIVLIVVGILAVLGIICCAGAVFVGSKFADIGVGTANVQQRIQAEIDPQAIFKPEQDMTQQGKPVMVLVLGVPGTIDDDRAAQLQDQFWKIYTDAFAEGGGFAVSGVAIGARNGGYQPEHHISVEDIVERTGLEAPEAHFMFEMGQQR